jgi:hypothetical protein
MADEHKKDARHKPQRKPWVAPKVILAKSVADRTGKPVHPFETAISYFHPILGEWGPS